MSRATSNKVDSFLLNSSFFLKFGFAILGFFDQLYNLKIEIFKVQGVPPSTLHFSWLWLVGAEWTDDFDNFEFPDFMGPPFWIFNLNLWINH